MRRFAITLDTGWAPDTAIDFTADLLASYGLKASWFITLDGPAVERLRRRSELFELIDHAQKDQRLAGLPCAFQDDLELRKARPSWDAQPLLAAEGELAVFRFHPIHVLLNTAELARYEELALSAPSLRDANPAQLSAHTHVGEGTRSVFLELLTQLSGGLSTVRLSDL
jgi:hypothetical protein